MPPDPPRGRGLYGPLKSHSRLLLLQWPLIPLADPLIPKVPVQSSTVQRTPPLQNRNQVSLEETLSDSWVRRFSEGPSPHAHVNQAYAFAKSLPRLNLARFSGSPLEWPHFIPMFKCLVHDMPLTRIHSE